MFSKRMRERVRRAIWGDHLPDPKDVRTAQTWLAVTIMLVVILNLSVVVVRVWLGSDITSIVVLVSALILTTTTMRLVLYAVSHRQ